MVRFPCTGERHDARTLLGNMFQPVSVSCQPAPPHSLPSRVCAESCSGAASATAPSRPCYALEHSPASCSPPHLHPMSRAGIEMNPLRSLLLCILLAGTQASWPAINQLTTQNGTRYGLVSTGGSGSTGVLIALTGALKDTLGGNATGVVDPFYYANGEYTVSGRTPAPPSPLVSIESRVPLFQTRLTYNTPLPPVPPTPQPASSSFPRDGSACPSTSPRTARTDSPENRKASQGGGGAWTSSRTSSRRTMRA